MDIPSNVCFAWFCRSTRPFQTFLVSNIGLHSWVQPNLLLYYSDIIQYTLSHSKEPGRFKNHLLQASKLSTAHAYWPQDRVNCGTLERRVPSSTRSYTVYFTTHAFKVLDNACPILTSYASFLCLIALPSREVVESPNYTRETLNLELFFITCLIFIYPHRGLFPPPDMGS